MRARDAFAQAQLRLQAAGCRYRIKEVARSPFVQRRNRLRMAIALM